MQRRLPRAVSWSVSRRAAHAAARPLSAPHSNAAAAAAARSHVGHRMLRRSDRSLLPQALASAVAQRCSPPSSPSTATTGLGQAPGLPRGPLTHDAVGAFPDAVQLLKLLHTSAPAQLKERGGDRAGMWQVTELKTNTSHFTCTEEPTRALLTKQKGNHTPGLFRGEKGDDETGSDTLKVTSKEA